MFLRLSTLESKTTSLCSVDIRFLPPRSYHEPRQRSEPSFPCGCCSRNQQLPDLLAVLSGQRSSHLSRCLPSPRFRANCRYRCHLVSSGSGFCSNCIQIAAFITCLMPCASLALWISPHYARLSAKLFAGTRFYAPGMK